MKKLLTSLLAIAMLLSCMALFSACAVSKPELDFDDAEDALEDAGYDVYCEEEEWDGCKVEALYAEDENDENYLEIFKFEKASTAKLWYKSMKMDIEGEILEYEQEIEWIKHQLEKYEDEMKSDEIDALKDELKELEKDLEEFKEENVIGRSGKYVWYGTADAIKDSKG